MGLSRKNAEAVSKLLSSLAQRQGQAQDLATRLAASVVWRSLDGSLAVELDEIQKHQLEEFITQYLDESEIIIGAVRGLMTEIP